MAAHAPGSFAVFPGIFMACDTGTPSDTPFMRFMALGTIRVGMGSPAVKTPDASVATVSGRQRGYLPRFFVTTVTSHGDHLIFRIQPVTLGTVRGRPETRGMTTAAQERFMSTRRRHGMPGLIILLQSAAKRQVRSALRNGMAEVTFHAQGHPVFSDMLAVMTPETPVPVSVSNIRMICFPIHLHFRKDTLTVNDEGNPGGFPDVLSA